MGGKLSVIIVIAIIVGIVGAGGYLLTKRLQQNTSTVGVDTNPNLKTTGSTNPDMPSAGKVTIAREVVVTASEYKFEPSEVHVKKGETVKITLKNSGSMAHNWTVENLMGASIDTVNAGQSSSITLTPSQKGTFTFFCSIGSHRKLGMVGKLIVE